MADARRAPLKDQTDVSGARVLIVEARFYDDIQDALLAGAVAELKAAGRLPKFVGYTQLEAESETLAILVPTEKGIDRVPSFTAQPIAATADSAESSASSRSPSGVSRYSTCGGRASIWTAQPTARSIAAMSSRSSALGSSCGRPSAEGPPSSAMRQSPHPCLATRRSDFATRARSSASPWNGQVTYRSVAEKLALALITSLPASS